MPSSQPFELSDFEIMNYTLTHSSMAFISATFLLFSIISISASVVLSASVVEDLHNLRPPPDFNSTITDNCINNPSLRYCNSSPSDLDEIFKSTIVASHLCNESKNPNCLESFPKIDLRNRPTIAPLYLSFHFFWKYCPLTILSIDLSNNSLKENFPTDILHCSQIQALDLSHNDLFGDFPLQSFSPLTNLSLLNLSYNHFSEIKISDTQFFKRFKYSSFIHSGLLPNHQKFRIKAVIFLIGFPIIVILMVGCMGWLCFRRPDYLPAVLRRKHKFTPSMLKTATNGFSKRNLVGQSDGVDIYKGILRGGTEVRIEKYREKISRENHRKFVEECKILVQLCHENLVRVLGWCDDHKLRAIVTEWTEGENVETWLSDSKPSWKQRLKIVMGVVEAMCYLQEQWPEVEYDLRPSSILLSDHREPLISRFRFGDQRSNSKDIYKFGVFLLEIIANRRPREEFERGEADFIEWVRMQYPKHLRKVIDGRMRKTENTYDQAAQGIALGLMCTDLSTGGQPSWDQIYDMVTGACKSFQDLTSSPTQK